MSHHDHKHDAEKELRRIEREVKEGDQTLQGSYIVLRELVLIGQETNKLIRVLIKAFAATIKYPVRFITTQGALPMAELVGTIKGLLPGQADTFFSTPVDATGAADALPDGAPLPTVTADDAAVVVGAVSLSNGVYSYTLTAPGVPSTPSFTITVSDTFQKADGTSATISSSTTIPYLTASNAPVGFVQSQGAPATDGTLPAAKR
jgi:hypothetical protein